eukprot:CAMPEP_0117504594 /NCGR_PEP_ID=MMETSP0784-20121206/24929_1 /TAXON_ID=39447 /ORGANISM="" /LENGTH=40 /DNA_ID= /DNA_START= /DNA_END= /DNA_ORIENTATION=
MTAIPTTTTASRASVRTRFVSGGRHNPPKTVPDNAQRDAR